MPLGAHWRIPGAPLGPQVYDGAVTGPAAQERPSDEVPPSRGRAATIGAVAFVLLGVPFLVFSGMMLTLKARVELQCNSGGPCALFQRSLLRTELVGMFAAQEITGASVERNRSSKKGAASVYRPLLETSRGNFPLSSRWLDDEAQAENTARVVKRFHANPFGGGGKGFMIFHDHRRGPLIVGISFGVVGVVLLGVSVWLAFKARRLFRAERAARPPSSPA